MIVITVLLIAVAVYLAAGLAFSIPFVTRGVTKIDEGAIGSKLGFRLIIIPGTIVFWPVLLKKWMKARKEFRTQNSEFRTEDPVMETNNSGTTPHG